MPLRPHYPQAQISSAGSISPGIVAAHPKAGLKKEFEDFSEAEARQWIQGIVDEQRENISRPWMALDIPALTNALEMAKRIKDEMLVDSVNAALLHGKSEMARRAKSAA